MVVSVSQRERERERKMEKITLGRTMATTTIVLAVMVAAAGGFIPPKGHLCGSTFFSALVEMIPCKASVSPFSPIPPTESCCNAIKALGQPCLCALLNGPPISGVDRNMVMQLPDKCTVNYQPCDFMK